MKKNYFLRSVVAGLVSLLLIGNANAQTTDTHRIWAKDATVLHDYYNWDNPIALVTAGTTNFNPSAAEIGSVTEGVSNAWNNCFLKFENVDFGTFTNALTFYRNVPRGAIIEFWVDRDETTRYDTFFNDGGHGSTGNKDVIELSGGTFLGSYQHWYNASGDWSRWEKFTIDINKIGGIHNLYVVFRAGGKTEVNQNLGGLYYIDLHRNLSDEITSLSATETTLSLPVGIHNLSYTFEPATSTTENLVWTVETQSAPGVLSVNNGSLIAMRAGTATVKCTSSRAAGDVSLSYNITVVGTSTEEKYVVQAETADTLYNTYNPVSDQTFQISDFQSNGVGNNGNEGIVYAWNTNFAIYEDVDFGSFTDTIKFYHAEIRGGAVEFWIDRDIIDERHANRNAVGDYYNPSGKELAGGTFLGRYEFLQGNDFRGNDKWAEFTLPIVPASGTHDLYVVFLRGGKGTYEKTNGHYDWFELNRNYADIYQIIPSETSVIMTKGDVKTITLSIVPEVVANSDVTWSVLSGGEYASVSNGLISALETGTAVIRVQSVANPAVYADITAVVTPTTSVSDAELRFTYNNPVSDNLFVQSNISISIENIVVSDFSGRVIYQNNNVNNAELNLNCSAWGAGLYFVQIKTTLETKVLKITKQ